MSLIFLQLLRRAPVAWSSLSMARRPCTRHDGRKFECGARGKMSLIWLLVRVLLRSSFLAEHSRGAMADLYHYCSIHA